jgi:hypothetical protein
VLLPQAARSSRNGSRNNPKTSRYFILSLLLNSISDELSRSPVALAFAQTCHPPSTSSRASPRSSKSKIMPRECSLSLLPAHITKPVGEITIGSQNARSNNIELTSYESLKTILPVVLGSVNTRWPISMPLPDGWKRARPLVPRPPPTLLCLIFQARIVRGPHLCCDSPFQLFVGGSLGYA